MNTSPESQSSRASTSTARNLSDAKRLFSLMIAASAGIIPKQSTGGLPVDLSAGINRRFPTEKRMAFGQMAFSPLSLRKKQGDPIDYGCSPVDSFDESDAGDNDAGGGRHSIPRDSSSAISLAFLGCPSAIACDAGSYLEHPSILQT
jgi:hypothetical protein